MKAKDVRIGDIYWAKVSGRRVKVQVKVAHHAGGWWAVNLATDREVRVRTAARLSPLDVLCERQLRIVERARQKVQRALYKADWYQDAQV